MLTIARTLMGNPELLLLDEPSERLGALAAFLRRAGRGCYAHPYDLIGRQAVATGGA